MLLQPGSQRALLMREQCQRAARRRDAETLPVSDEGRAPSSTLFDDAINYAKPSFSLVSIFHFSSICLRTSASALPFSFPHICLLLEGPLPLLSNLFPARHYMLPAIPNPREYDVSVDTGFVPETLPLSQLPDPYYAPWEAVAENLQFLIMTRQLRAVVSAPSFPILSLSRLRTGPEKWRAYSILGFMAHGYIWGGPEPAEVVPDQIARPLLDLAKILEVPPLCTYAGLCLWNHRPIFADSVEPKQLDLSSLATLHTFTGSIDESWFYLVSTAIEIRGAACIAHILEAMHAARRDSPHDVVVALQLLAESIDTLIPMLARLPEQCDPHTFYFRIRPFLAGSKNMASAGLPRGVKYGSEGEYLQFAGGSNAQSSLIQALDIALGIVHRPTESSSNDESSSDAPNDSFIHEMRKYMPGPHRRFLEQLELAANIRDYVNDHKKSNSALTLAYDACLAVLRAFRDKHIQIVSRYIIVQARTTSSASTTSSVTSSHPPSKAGIGIAGIALTDKKSARGTGGTSLIPFLKQARDETGEPAAGSWAARLLRDDASCGSKRKMRDAMGFGEHENQSPAVGLAGKWSMDDDYGGICHW
ncbi:Indoleamine 2,3-dioxygenase-domain-containing protein [Limtongia smithiae]|uniref:Indoleamine 2,3-dioxygenase-domain-containing protein n=1 Tax=Limtongia smithiae TaxID=1125753 RepID=UPI0034CFA0CB